MKRFLPFAVSVLLLIVVAYELGPHPSAPVYSTVLPAVPQMPAALERYVKNNEAGHDLKPDNEARIVWHDTLHGKTDYSVVYLHGFSASSKEGDPVHLDFAKRYGCNLYLSRLDAHGLDTTEPLLTMTADGLWEDAKKALFIGKSLGYKVILMSTSTGGTLALKLAATYPDDVYAVINMSPNIAINDNMVFLTNNPWGLQLSRFVRGSNYNVSKNDNAEIKKYWYSKYRLEAVGELENLVETTMTPETFGKVKQPALNLYYYKDEQHQDKTVKVSAILDMEKQLATPDDMKEAIAIPGAGGHVLGCWLTSQDIPAVERAIDEFAERKLKMKPFKH